MHSRVLLSCAFLDYLYFQQAFGLKQLVIADQKGVAHFSMQLGSDSASGPWVSDVVVDAQLQMWHIFEDSSAVAVYSDEGELVAAYDVLTAGGAWDSRIDIDQRGTVLVSGWAEQALLTLSSQGDITRTLASRVPPMYGRVSLMADYSGGGNGSLVVGAGETLSAISRISIDSGEEGTLLRRYPLPAHLASTCYYQAMDVGARTGNIYALL